MRERVGVERMSRKEGCRAKAGSSARRDLHRREHRRGLIERVKLTHADDSSDEFSEQRTCCRCVSVQGEKKTGGSGSSWVSAASLPLRARSL